MNFLRKAVAVVILIGTIVTVAHKGYVIYKRWKSIKFVDKKEK